MLNIFAQARFPKPEFTEAYQYPSMGLQESVFAPDWFKFGIYVLLMGLVVFGIYKLRSKKFLFFTSVLSLLIIGFYWKGCPCPVGLTQNTSAFLSGANSYYPFVYFAIFALPLVLAMFLGRVFCGGACPLGAVQEILLLKPLRLPYALEMVLRQLPYFVLVCILIFAAIDAPFVLCKLDPFAPIFRMAAPLGIAIFSGIVVVLSLFISRPYCRFLCPYGVLLKFASFLSKREVKIAPNTCVNCKLCEDACPNGAIIAPDTGRVFETPEKIKARIKNILIFSPLFILGCALAGFVFGDFISIFNSDTELLAMLDASEKNVDTDAFFAKGISIPDYREMVELTIWKLRAYFALGGAVLAFVIILETLRSSKRKTNETYIADMGSCLCCGRCYEACPDEILRRNKNDSGK